MASLTRFDVFIPSDFPTHSYVNRKFKDPRTGDDRDPEEEIREALLQKGRIIQVSGPSKSGKTIALENVIGLHRLITISGSRITSALSLWESVVALLRLPVEVVEENTEEAISERELSADVKAKLIGAEFGGGVKSKQGNHKSNGQQASFKGDAFQDAVDGLKLVNKVLFIDDFHTMPQDIKRVIASQLKAATELGVKICLADVPHRADEPISANPDLTGRVAKISFNYWTESDLQEIGSIGFLKLKVHLSQSALIALAAEAGGSPQLMQLLCLQTAKVLGADEEQKQLVNATMSRDQLDIVFIKAVQEVEREAIFNLFDKGPDERGKARTTYDVKGLGKGDNYEATLAALSLDPPKSHFYWDQGTDSLSNRIDKLFDNEENKPRREQISRTLDHMIGLARKHMPSATIMDWSGSKGLYILDPYFLFYLRWSEKYLPVRKHFRRPMA